MFNIDLVNVPQNISFIVEDLLTNPKFVMPRDLLDGLCKILDKTINNDTIAYFNLVLVNVVQSLNCYLRNRDTASKKIVELTLYDIYQKMYKILSMPCNITFWKVIKAAESVNIIKNNADEIEEVSTNQLNVAVFESQNQCYSIVYKHIQQDKFLLSYMMEITDSISDVNSPELSPTAAPAICDNFARDVTSKIQELDSRRNNANRRPRTTAIESSLKKIYHML